MAISQFPNFPTSQVSGFLLLGLLISWHTALTAWGAAQWTDEEPLFRQIVRYDPDSVVAHNVLAWILSTKRKDAEAGTQIEAVLRLLYGSQAWGSRATAVRALATDPRILIRTRQNQGSDRPPREWLATLYATLGNDRLHTGHTAPAVAAFRIGEAILPQDADINVGLGYCASLSGDRAEAIRRMRAALREWPRCPDAHEFLARDALRRGDWPTARDESAAWLDASPDSQDARAALAEARSHSSSLIPP